MQYYIRTIFLFCFPFFNLFNLLLFVLYVNLLFYERREQCLTKCIRNAFLI